MRTTDQFSTALPLDMAESVERWLREEVIAGHKEYLADPSQGVPAEAILGRLKARRAAQKASP